MNKRPGGFADPSLLLLTSLSDGPKHGYAMIEDIARLSGIELGPGTLYGAISRLEERGLIEPLEANDRRRPYRITTEGMALLRAELGTMERIARAGQQRVGRTHLTHAGTTTAATGTR
jgi:DNA-binding PadR family transcriptional regulator